MRNCISKLRQQNLNPDLPVLQDSTSFFTLGLVENFVSEIQISCLIEHLGTQWQVGICSHQFLFTVILFLHFVGHSHNHSTI